MTISIRISRSEPPVERPVGGLVGAFVGGTQYIQQGSTDVEITADEAAFETAGELAGWVEEVAPVAASTFRHAALGEIVALFTDEAAGPNVADLRTTTEAEADANAEGYVGNGDADDFVDEDAEYGIVMPFTIVQSKGGPHEDSAFTSGYRMGTADMTLSTLNHLGALAWDYFARVEEHDQLDLIAMRHGYSVTMVELTDGWATFDFRRVVPTRQAE